MSVAARVELTRERLGGQRRTALKLNRLAIKGQLRRQLRKVAGSIARAKGMLLVGKDQTVLPFRLNGGRKGLHVDAVVVSFRQLAVGGGAASGCGKKYKGQPQREGIANR